MVGKTVNWKLLVGTRFCLIYLLSLFFVLGTLNTHESNQSNPCFGRYSNRTPRNTDLEPYPLSDKKFRLLLMRLEQLLQPQISYI